MASSLIALLDDIATVLDDLAVMTKAAAKKSAGVLGDDLALNAQQVTGVRASREFPVVWAVAKGSLVNKAILVPAALLISAIAPWAVTPLLILGGAFLCFEGVEKLAHKLFHAAGDHPEEAAKDPDDRTAEEAAADALRHIEEEKGKIKGAIRTDFVLSAEIVVITLGTVADESFFMRFGVLVAIAMLMTVGVYGLVACIVRLDDLGMALARKSSSTSRNLGKAILAAAPWLMRALSIAGTAAMFLVGGGILVHDVAPLHDLSAGLTHTLSEPVKSIVEMLFTGLVGVLLGALVLGLVTLGKRIWERRAA